jgi:hypothetical protein
MTSPALPVARIIPGLAENEENMLLLNVIEDVPPSITVADAAPEVPGCWM